ncbi:hypothetical protein MW887_008239 [Aspergillus wentii]|nr:hypothetical protein MW887_008239 [Aspergillus wentii]
MLGETEVRGLSSHLGAVVRENQQHHENLQDLLEKFQGLLQSYNELKSDYEEEKEAREKYKRLARGQERNPFALVLVDGDGYIFKEHLIKKGPEGGIAAARLLSDTIKELLHERLGYLGDQCRIMVRIYSNILGLSKTMARAGLVGNEARSLSPFASSFTRAQELFDYVDAGDKKEGADYKIREETHQVPLRDQTYYAKNLPAINAKSEEFIAVNKDGDRVDTYCPQPPQDAWELYNRRAKRHKLCNKYHLGGECGDMACEYDHSHIDGSALNVMRYILRQHPCSRGATCRAIKCYLGHICQKDLCKGTKPCRFPRQAHTLELRVSQWLTPVDQHDIHESPISENSVNSTTDPNNTFSYLMKGILD